MYTPISLTDADAEALLEGADDVKADLADIAEVVASIRAIGSHGIDKDYSHLIAAAALESRATPVERFAAEQAAVAAAATSSVWDRTARVVPRVAVGAAALFMLIISSAGLAYAANGAKPGDLLYGLDRAAEVIGVFDGGPNERYDEAQALIAAGEVPGGLALATEILDRMPGGDEAKPAVAAALSRLEEGDDGPGTNVADQVGALLGYIHDSSVTGFIDVNTVSDYAQQIGGPPGVPPGQTDDTPGGSGEAPGQTGDNPGQSGGEEGPPGQEGTAPGQDGESDESENASDGGDGGQEATEEADGGPGNSDQAPGHTDQNPGQSGGEEGPPGQEGTAPGQNKGGEEEPATQEGTGEAPGNSGSAPGQQEEPPGPPEEPRGNSGSAPGRNK